MTPRKLRDKYRVIAVDRPGYTGEMRSFPTKEEALEYAEGFMRTRKPAPVPAWAERSGARAHVLIEELERGGYSYPRASWEGRSGQWHPTR